MFVPTLIISSGKCQRVVRRVNLLLVGGVCEMHAEFVPAPVKNVGQVARLIMQVIGGIVDKFVHSLYHSDK